LDCPKPGEKDSKFLRANPKAGGVDEAVETAGIPHPEKTFDDPSV